MSKSHQTTVVSMFSEVMPKIATSLMLLTFVSYTPGSFGAQENEKKNSQDPTKIVTKLGVGYSDNLSLSGSISLDGVRKINARINNDASEWRLGGSWLFDVGIFNFSFSRSEYDNGSYKNDYSIGSYAPLSRYGFTPGGWQPFLRGGYSYKTGETMQASVEEGQGADLIVVNNSSNSGYVGFFAFKPLNEQWSLMSFAGGSIGSNDYRGYWVGGGFSYKPAEQHSFNSYAYLSDDDFGKREKIGVSYTYEFE